MTEASVRQGLSVRACRVVPAAPGLIWSALTDTGTMPTWWGKTDKAEMFASEADVRAGGQFRFGMRAPQGGENVVVGNYIDVDRPYKLAFTWSSESRTSDIVDTRVTIDLHDLKDGSTRVVISHEGLPSPHVAHAYTAGWHNMLQDMSLHFVNG